MTQFFTPQNVITSGWQDTGAIVKLLDKTDRVLIGLDSTDVVGGSLIARTTYVVEKEVDASMLCLDILPGNFVEIISTATGTGAYLPMTFWTNGAERVRIDNSGNVGIGTSAPLYPLHIERSGDGFVSYAHRSGGSDWSVYTSATLTKIGTQAASSLVFVINGADTAILNTNGFFGVGTTSPNAPIHIKYTTQNVLLRLENSTDPIPAQMHFDIANGRCSIIADVGEISIGDGAGPTLLNVSSSYGVACGVFTCSSLSSSTNARLAYAPGSYNVQIGLLSPDQGYKLYVAGTLRVTGDVTLDGNIFASSSANTMNVTLFDTAIGSADASAFVQINSTTKGFLPPRMTTAQRDAISSPASGLIIYNTTTGKLNVRGASAWEAITSA